MKEFLSKIKFEYVYAVLILVVLSTALFVFKDNSEVVSPIVTALVAGLTGITTFFFTKHTPGK